MVAAHIKDLRAAASVGMKTIYVPRSDDEENPTMVGNGVMMKVKSKDEGGEVDCVVNSFLELSERLRSSRLQE